jgi:hypothetical protein
MLKVFQSHVRHNVVGYIALFIALGGTTYAATGGNFILGQSNSATSTTALSAGTTGPAFKVTNTSTGAAGSFNAAAGHPALAVNTAAKVAKLNADLLDGKDSTNWKVSNVIDAVGPLPVQVTYTTSGGKLLIMASGSGYRSSNEALHSGVIGMDVDVDGGPVGSAATLTNEMDSHKSFVADYVVVSGLAAGPHTIGLSKKYNVNACNLLNETAADYCTTTDGSDFFHVAVIELPF